MQTQSNILYHDFHENLAKLSTALQKTTTIQAVILQIKTINAIIFVFQRKKSTKLVSLCMQVSFYHCNVWHISPLTDEFRNVFNLTVVSSASFNMISIADTCIHQSLLG